MGALDRIFGRLRSGASPTLSSVGTVRIGTTHYNAQWTYARALNQVYANPTGFACVQRIKNDFSRPPWAVYSDASPDQPLTTGKGAELLNVLNKPDPMMSGTAMQQQIAIDLELNGRSVWLQLRGKDMWGDKGPLTGLQRLPCEMVTVLTGYDRELLGFIYTDGRGVQVPILPSEVLYFHYFHPQNYWEGFPPAYVAGLPAEIDEHAKKFNHTLLANDGAMPGYLTVEGLTPEQFQRFKALWEAEADPGRTRFLGGGGDNAKTTYTKVGLSNQELMYDKLRDYSQAEICTSFGMSPLVLNPTDATFANGDSATVGYMKSKIGGMWAMVADQGSTQVQDDYSGLRIGFDLEEIEELNEGADSQVNRLAILIDKKVITPEAAAEQLGLDPADVPKPEPIPAALDAANQPPALNAGDQAPVDAAAEPKKHASKSLHDRPAFERRFNSHEAKTKRAMERYFEHQNRVIARKLRSRRGKAFEKVTSDYFDAERWDAELTDTSSHFYSDTTEAFGAWMMLKLQESFDVATDFNPDDVAIAEFVTSKSSELAGQVNETTADALAKAISDLTGNDVNAESAAKAVEEYFANNSDSRAALTASMVTVLAASFGQIQAGLQSGAPVGKKWNTYGAIDDVCVGNEDDGVIALDQSFTSGHDTPPGHFRCICNPSLEPLEGASG